MPGVDHCLQKAMAIPGAVGAGIVDYTTGLPVATTGAAPDADHEAAAAGAAEVVQAAISRSSLVSAVPHDLLEDLIITTSGGYHLLRPVRTGLDSRLVLYVWLDRAHGNLAVARRRMQMLADELRLIRLPGPPATAVDTHRPVPDPGPPAEVAHRGATPAGPPSDAEPAGTADRPRLARREPGAELPEQLAAAAPPVHAGADELLLERLRTALRALR